MSDDEYLYEEEASGAEGGAELRAELGARGLSTAGQDW